MRDMGLGDKVYSPDLQTYELEGTTGLFGTIASLVVGPIRIVSRVMHNIMILPANLLDDYARGLLVISILFTGLGLADLIVFRKWPLVVSQIPVLIIAAVLRQRTSKAAIVAAQKREVEIDDEQVQELANSLYRELDIVIGKEQVRENESDS